MEISKAQPKKEARHFAEGAIVTAKQNMQYTQRHE